MLISTDIKLEIRAKLSLISLIMMGFKLTLVKVAIYPPMVQTAQHLAICSEIVRHKKTITRYDYQSQHTTDVEAYL